jgi:hypothetical protein
VVAKGIENIYTELSNNMDAMTAVRSGVYLESIPRQTGVIGMAIVALPLMIVRAITGISYGLSIITALPATIISMWPSLFLILTISLVVTFIYYIIKKPKVLFGYVLSPEPECPVTWESMLRIGIIIFTAVETLYLALCVLSAIPSPLQVLFLSLLAITQWNDKGAVGIKNKIVREELEVIKATALSLSASSTSTNSTDTPVRLSLVYRATNIFTSVRLQGIDIEGQTAQTFSETLDVIFSRSIYVNIVAALRKYLTTKSMSPDQISSTLANQANILGATINQMREAQSKPSNSPYVSSYKKRISELTSLQNAYGTKVSQNPGPIVNPPPTAPVAQETTTEEEPNNVPSTSDNNPPQADDTKNNNTFTVGGNNLTSSLLW